MLALKPKIKYRVCTTKHHFTLLKSLAFSRPVRAQWVPVESIGSEVIAAPHRQKQSPVGRPPSWAFVMHQTIVESVRERLDSTSITPDNGITMDHSLEDL